MPTDVNIYDLYKEQADFFVTDSLKKNIAIVNQTPENLSFRCDDYILGTILRNAISNAMNHVQPGEAVVLSAEQKDGHRILLQYQKCMQQK